MRLDSKQKKIVQDLMVKYNLEEQQVLNIIESPFIFIRNTIKNLDITDVETEEQFKNKTKNFNIPRIGKLYANYYNFKKLKHVRQSQ